MVNQRSKDIYLSKDARTVIEDGEEYGATGFGDIGKYMLNKERKLLNADISLRNKALEAAAQEGGSQVPQIFRNCVMCVNGYTRPPAHELRRLIVVHGGIHLTNMHLSGKTGVTHIIATNLTSKKKLEFRNYKVVTPEWVTESVRQGKLLDWSQFRLIVDGTNRAVTSAFAPVKPVVASESFEEMLEGVGSTQSEFGVAVPAPTAPTRPLKVVADAAGTLLPPPVASSSRTGTSNNPGNQLRRPIPSFSSFELSFDDPFAEAQPEVKKEEEVGDMTQEDVQQEATGQGKPTGDILDLVMDCPSDFDPFSSIGTVGDTKGSQDEIEKVADRTQEVQNDLESVMDISETTPEVSEAPEVPGSFEDLDDSASIDSSEEEEEEDLPEDLEQLQEQPSGAAYAIDDPRFISHFYAKSRLHHLSTWKAKLKTRFESWSADKPVPPGPETGSRIIMHLDFDSFFVAASTLDRPDLQGKPVAVGSGGSKNADIASCNYEARKFGVKNGMWMSQALKLCPDLKSVSYDFPRYESISETFYKVLLESKLDYIRPVSVDEALVDATSLVMETIASSQASVSDEKTTLATAGLSEDVSAACFTVASRIAARIRNETKCNISVGCASNILLAKLALREAKPNGIFSLFKAQINSFMAKTKISDIPGVGRSIAGLIGQKLHVSTAGALAALPDAVPRISALLGPKRGPQLLNFCLGKDGSPLAINSDLRKSVSVEISFGVRFQTPQQLSGFIDNMAAELSARLQDISVLGSQLTVRLYIRKNAHESSKFMGHGQCHVINRSVSLAAAGATDESREIATAAKVAVRALGYGQEEIRGVGLSMTKLTRDKGKGKAKQGVLDFNNRPAEVSLPPPGTQFHIPEDIDPAVLPFLPPDIRRQIEAKRAAAAAQGLPKDSSRPSRAGPSTCTSISDTSAVLSPGPMTPSKLPISPSKRSNASPSPSKPSRSPLTPTKQPSMTQYFSPSPVKRPFQSGPAILATSPSRIKRQKANTNITHLIQQSAPCSEEMETLKRELAHLRSSLGPGTPAEVVSRIMPLVNSQTDMTVFAQLSSSIQQEVLLDYRNEVQRKIASVSRQLEDLKEKERIQKARAVSVKRTLSLGTFNRKRPDTAQFLLKLRQWVLSSADGPHQDDVLHVTKRLKQYRAEGYHETVHAAVRWLSKLGETGEWSLAITEMIQTLK